MFAPFKRRSKTKRHKTNVRNPREKGEKMKMRKDAVVFAIIVLGLTALLSSATESVNAGGNPPQLRSMVNKELNWLGAQEVTDHWEYTYPTSKPSVGLTALCILDYINFYITPPNDPAELNWLVSQVQTDGSITIPPGVNRDRNDVYDTSLSIAALVAANEFNAYLPAGGLPALRTIINNAVGFLLDYQNVHGASVRPKDPAGYVLGDKYWGGWGYPSQPWGTPTGPWADLSNTQFAVLGLAAASWWSQHATLGNWPSIAPGASVWQNAAIYAIRCWNDVIRNPSWHNSVCDEGFTYQPGGGSYASMTGAGIWVLDLCKNAGISTVTVDSAPNNLLVDETLAYGWLVTKNDGWSQNVGNGQTWFYYYVNSVAKAFLFIDNAFGISTNNWWVYGTNQMYDRLSALAIPGVNQVHWSNPSDLEETDVTATAFASLACEAGLISLPSPYLKVLLASNANLWITDPLGRHIGFRMDTGAFVNEIPDATYNAGQVANVTIPNPLVGGYDIKLKGTGNGSYNLTTYGTAQGDPNMYFPRSFVDNITTNAVKEYVAVACSTIGPFTVITTEGPPPTPAHAVGGTMVPVDKIGVLAPYISFASAILFTPIATALYIIRRKRKKMAE